VVVTRLAIPLRSFFRVGVNRERAGAIFPVGFSCRVAELVVVGWGRHFPDKPL